MWDWFVVEGCGACEGVCGEMTYAIEDAYSD